MWRSFLFFLIFICIYYHHCEGRGRRRKHRHSTAGIVHATQKRERKFDTKKHLKIPKMMRQKKKKNRECDRKAKYRSLDGTCNNLRHPQWGAAGQPYRRLIAPHYHDGISLPRLHQINNKPLPSPRLVTDTVFSTRCKVVAKNTVMIMAFGQFLSYDIAGTPKEKLEDGKKCCDEMGTSTHPDVEKNGPCFPISIPKGDCHFRNSSCMEFVRSFSVTDKHGVREQINQRSAYIDGSTIYGNTRKEMKKLRVFSGGRLKGCRKGFLPKSRKSKCIKTSKQDYCMLAGDQRVNIYPVLGAIHTLFFRYHNYIAGELAQVHPDYDDETLFQETRRIVIAVLQTITLKEYLPRMLRRSKVSDRLLYGNWTYKKRCDATVFNVIPTVVLRYGHSMVPDYLPVHCDKVALKDLFLKPTYVLNGLDSLVKHATTERALTVDRWVSWGMVNHIVEEVNGQEKDMLAINIQRGRDHGIPAYSHWRRLCNLRPLTDFSQFPSMGDKFREVYDHVDDVDLYSAALVEKRVGVVGRTFACLLTRQFERLRFCDRFWFENTDPRIGFSDELRQEIEKTKMSHIICLTTGIYDIQRHVFKMANKHGNKPKPCSKFLKKAMNVRLF